MSYVVPNEPSQVYFNSNMSGEMTFYGDKNTRTEVGESVDARKVVAVKKHQHNRKTSRSVM